MEALTTDHVQAALDSFNLGIKIRLFENSTATSQQAADNIGCELGQIAKSLAFIIDGQPIVVIASGDQRVDDKKLAALYNVGRKKVRSATPEQCVEIYGYAPGGVAPLGYRTPGLPVYLDESGGELERICLNAGGRGQIVELGTLELVELVGAQLVDLSATPRS